jgi:2-oxoisovalerate dehydrogenase E1 component
MILSREGDRREGILLRQSKGWFQVSGMGHEALAAAAYSLGPDDYIFPYYRDRALMLARGITNYDLALAYFAKADSSSAGRQMPGHYSDRDKNVFSVCTPTAGSTLPACGAAWAMKLQGKNSVCLATVGDASTRQGEFFEAFAFALQEKLPLVFLVEDNKYGISTPTAKFLPFHLGLLSMDHVVPIDGRDPEVVGNATSRAVERARNGEGPTLIWADLDRLSSHTSSDDHRVYRELKEIAAMDARDPIKLLSERLVASGELSSEEYQNLLEEARITVDRDYQNAEREADPDPRRVEEGMFGKHVPAEAPPIQTGRQTMVSAINQTFRKALESDPSLIFFGEDIEDPKGGVFGLTKGLSVGYPNQVFNSPLAEATIMGVAVGMAAYGLKPVFELQFIDFIAPGWNQITTNMSTLRWRSDGKWKCPCVIFAPYGAYLPGGSIWHSQSNEASLAHAAGARVAIPSTPEDAAGLFWTAIQSDDPCFILVPKHIFRKQVDVEDVKPVPFGKARIVQAGSDVTLVTYGNTIEIAELAAIESGVSVEIIDLRSIHPCDYDSIEKSLKKTGRLVVVQEDAKTCGFGQCVIAEVCSNPSRFNFFLSSPQLVAREDVPVGYNPIWEYAALPDVARVRAAIDTVME